MICIDKPKLTFWLDSICSQSKLARRNCGKKYTIQESIDSIICEIEKLKASIEDDTVDQYLEEYSRHKCENCFWFARTFAGMKRDWCFKVFGGLKYAATPNSFCREWTDKYQYEEYN